ncbi:MAG: FecR domain-containing protein [Cyclobacteriaceae bacterium]|nr:FecR domain-containing protein [Cyclobacteriaceae bacterium]
MDYTKHTAEDFASNDSFVRYYLRENERDIFYWEKWIDGHPEKYKEISAAKQLLEMLSLGLSQNELDEEFNKMKHHIDEKTTLEDRSLKINPPHIVNAKLKRNNVIRIAAALIFILTSAAVVIHLTSESNREIVTTDQELIVNRNSKGQKSLIQLQDGSVIRLNSNSEIRYYENFTHDVRTVELKGEAFFEVASDPNRPFIVNTENISIKALGTSFNVNAFGESKALRVSLVTGKVEVNIDNDDTNKSILEPGEGLSFDRKSKLVTKEKFDPEIILAWRRGIIYFKDTSWEEIIITLERWFDVEFEVISSPRMQNLYSGQFDNQSLELVLESLSFSKDFKYRISGKKILIDFSQ